MSKDKVVKYVGIWAVACWATLFAYVCGFMLTAGTTPPNSLQLIALFGAVAVIPFVLVVAWSSLD